MQILNFLMRSLHYVSVFDSLSLSLLTGKVHGGSTGNMLPMAPPTAPTGMVYPHMLPQHFAPYGTPHMMVCALIRNHF